MESKVLGNLLLITINFWTVWNQTPLLCIAELVIEIPRHMTYIHVMTLVAAVVSTAATLQNYRAIQEWQRN